MKKFSSAIALFILLNPCFSQYRIGFRIAGNTSNQHYQMRVNTPVNSNLLGEPIFIDINGSTVVYTPAIYPSGSAIFFMQQEGARQTLYNGNTTGTANIANGDLIIDLTLETVSATPRVGIRINKPPAGKSFLYTLDKVRGNQELSTMTITAPDNMGYFPGPLNPGDTVYLYFVPQTPMWSSLGSRSNFVIPNKDTLIDVSMGYLAAVYIDRIGLNEKFKFELRHTGQPKDTVVVVAGNRGAAYFMKNRYYEGDTLYARQIGGPRVCSMPPYTLMTNTNTFISSNCGVPGRGDSNLYQLGVRIRDYDAGSYGIQVPVSGSNTGQYISVRDSVYYYGRVFYSGDTVLVSQFFGDKTVKFAKNPVIIGHADIIIDGYIGNLPGKTKIMGTYTGPAGSRVVLRSRDNEEISVTAGPDGTAAFRFTKEYEAGQVYNVSVKTKPANCNCTIVPSAEGVMPMDSSGLKVICNTAVELASRSTDNKFTNTFYETATPVIGGLDADEGRYVAFVSYGVGLDGSAGKYRQIFWRDMKTGVTKMISRAPDGTEGNNNSLAPAISADGKSVAFESYATNILTSDNNGARDVYLWKEGAGISWISQGGNAESYEPRIDRDGHSVVFSSYASTLTGGVDGTSTVNVFLSNGGALQLLTKDPKTGKGVGGSAPDISEEGDRIVFCSISAKLTNDDNNGLWDIFLWSKGSTGLRRVSKTSSGGEREQGDESTSRVVQASISGNGRFAAFATTAGNMVPYDYNKTQDVFITDLDNGRVSRLSLNNNAEEGNGDSPIEQGGRIGITYDGKWVCFQTNATNLETAKGNIIMKNIVTGETRAVTNSIYNTAGRPLISRYGAYVVAGCSEKMDRRFPSSGIFRFFTGK